MRIKDLLSEDKAKVPPKPRNFVAKNAKMGGAGQHKDKKKAEKQGDVKHKKELATMEGTLSELSTDKLAQYKKAAHADAKQADADGDYARGDKRFKGINKATNKQFDNDLKKHGQQGVSERVRDPEEWDEGDTEPGNNFAVYINGKKWKVFPGPAGAYADSPEEKRELGRLQAMAQRKSQESGKKWEVYVTGEPATK